MRRFNFQLRARSYRRAHPCLTVQEGERGGGGEGERKGCIPLATSNKQLATSRPGFTLIEIITVLTIMIIVLAVAIPVWNVVTGGHSLAAAQNQIASTLATARADAMYNRQTIGIFFFVDPATGQVAMAEVQADPQATGGTTYTPARVSPNWALYTAYHDPGGTPPPANNGPVNALEMVSDYVPGGFAYRRDLVLLPPGVGVALYNNYYNYIYDPTLLPLPQTFDRYVRLGAIMFDAYGMLTSIPFAVQQTRTTPYGNFPSQLGKRLGLRPLPITPSDPAATGDLASVVPVASGTPPLPAAYPTTPFRPPANGLYPLISQVGLLLYDRDAFLSQKTSGGRSFSDSDFQYVLPSPPNPPYAFSPPLTAADCQDKEDEETWLDQNGIASMVSPFNGALIKAK